MNSEVLSNVYLKHIKLEYPFLLGNKRTHYYKGNILVLDYNTFSDKDAKLLL